MRLPYPSFLAFQAIFCEASNQEVFDYVILGGGTAGLVLANRLSQDPKISVAVVEAGDSVKNNPNVTQIKNFFINLNTSIDWQYQTQPQKFTDDRVLVYHSGKALGGTSTINGATYMRAQKAQIDAWEQLGNHGWNWNSLLPYYKKSEAFQPPTPQLVAKGAEYDPAVHGYNGNVHVGWTNYMQNNSAPHLLNQTFQNLAIPYNKDQSSGNVHGFSIFPSTILSTSNTRADAARNYLYPIQPRPNLHLFPNTFAEKILWSSSSSSNSSLLKASSIQIRSSNPKSPPKFLKFTREVILSSGTLQSPLLLERSGIGNPSILSPLGIKVRHALPSVGENLQDQPLTSTSASATLMDFEGYTPYVLNPTAHDLFGEEETEGMASYLSGKIPGYAARIAAESKGSVTAGVVERQLRIQAGNIFNKSTPCGEVIWVPGKGGIQAVFWPLVPFSRGGVHLNGKEGEKGPGIDPGFFMLDWDARVAAAIGSFVRRALRTEPLGKLVGEFVAPNVTEVPVGAGWREWLPYLKQSYSPNYHPVGTCAMMSRDLGGVVDPQLRVYGTQNVRVVDASILPFQVDGHLTRYDNRPNVANVPHADQPLPSTIYAVAERAADIIKRTIR